MLNWKSVWNNEDSYDKDDVVTYGGSSYVALTIIQAGASPPSKNDTDWEPFVRGIRWRGNWDETISYLKDDAVAYEGSSYIASKDLRSNNGSNPSNTSGWDVLAATGLPGMTWRGPWADTVQYHKNDATSYNDGSYIAKSKPPIGTPPTDPMYWSILGQEVLEEVNKQAMGIASLVISSFAAVGTIAQAFFTAKGNAVSNGINAAQTLANTAQTAATAAQNTANTAQNTANAAAQDAQAAENTTNRAVELLTHMFRRTPRPPIT